MAENTQLAATLKSQDTEEWLDIHFTRPLGLLWARFFRRCGVHPNVVTVLSIFLGAGAGVCFYFEDYRLTLLGILLLVWANVYDSCDGQLARMTGQKTRLGRVLDGFAGDVWFFSIYFFICLRLTHREVLPGHTWGVWIWIIAFISGVVFHAKQCQLADYYRNVHLFFLKGESGSELDNSGKLRAEYESLSWKHDFIWKLFLFFYRNYTHAQEALTPNFQKLRASLSQQFAGRSLPEQLRSDFRAGSLPLMKWTNILTFNTRAIVLYVVLLFKHPELYFFFEIVVMTPLALYMRSRHEALCRRLLARLPQYA